MKPIIILLSLYLITSCTFSRTNMEGDKIEAEKIITKFYKGIKTKDYNLIKPLISNKLWKVTDSVKFHKLIMDVNRKFGTLRDYTLSSWNTKITVGTTSEGVYVFFYKAKYDSCVIDEKISLNFEKKEGIKIIGYHLTLDQL